MTPPNPKMLEAELTITNNVIAISGALSFASVLSVRAAGLSALRHLDNPILDFSKVTKVDSAGMALILDFWRFAHSLKKKLAFRQVPKAMEALMNVSNVREVLTECL